MLRRSHSYSSLQKVEVENEVEEEEGDHSSVIQAYEHEKRYSILRWYPGKNRKPMVNFSATCVLLGTPEDCMEMIKKYRLGYKFVKTESKLVRNIFASHGFREMHPNSMHFNVMWTGSHLKPYTLRALTEFQKVNHFPRSYELTRKDRLYKNIQRMQHTKGLRHFDFVPQSFVFPSELNDFYAAFLKDRGPWIVKPCASSRGRGIYLINHTNQIPLDETVLVCKYIHNPLLINGFKFDCRIYVAVTSYDPLRVYIYEEGLARFSTVKYEKDSNNLHNQWMHLTNYSVNKTSDDYIRCEDPEIEDYGSKWSFSAMLRCLKELGKDTGVLLQRIEDVIIKTIISGEMAIATACKMFVPHRGNCFELFGFDILLDENLKPWLLEVNLSPSLACDSPLDLKIKSNLISDLFNLTGIVADDPTMKKPPKLIAEAKRKQRLSSGSYSNADLKSLATKSINKINDGLSNEERRVLRETKEEYKRRGNFIRVYPSAESWELYGSLQEHQTTFNKVIHAKLYPELWNSSQRPQSAMYIARARNFTSIDKAVFSEANENSVHGQMFQHRYVQYMRKLSSWSTFDHAAAPSQDEISVPKASLVQGQLQDPPLQNYERGLITKRTKNYETIDVKDLISKGQHLDKFQAREAFAVYLQRVQHRLLQEISSSHDVMFSQISIGEVEKQEQQIDLIHRFLLKAAVNLSNPINIVVPHKNLPILERKKTLARQLNDFVRVYTRETQLLSANEDNHSDTQGATFVIDGNSFQMFLAVSSESELEEILTTYTRHNRSASIFLGAKPSKYGARAKHETSEANPSSKSRYPSEEKIFPKRSQSASSAKNSVSLNRPKSWKQNLKRATSHDGSVVTPAIDNDSDTCHSDNKPPSGKNKLLRPLSTCSNRLLENNTLHQRHFSRPSTSDSRIHSRSSNCHQRHHSADSLVRTRSASKLRPDSSKQRLHSIATVCAYTGADDMLKHYWQLQRREPGSRLSSRPPSGHCTSHDAEEVRLKKALNKLSIKQSERTYCSNNIKSHDRKTSKTKLDANDNRLYNDLHSDAITDDDKLEEFIRYGDKFVLENEKSFKTDRKNCLHQTASTQTVDKYDEEDNSKVRSDKRRTVYGVPRPPEGKKPTIKKHFSSQRMNRLLQKK